MAKKYTLSYTSGATGFGWSHDYDRLEEFESFVKEESTDYTARVTVWDEELGKFVYWKNCLTHEPRIDMLSDLFRDFRTTTRKMKEVGYGVSG